MAKLGQIILAGLFGLMVAVAAAEPDVVSRAPNVAQIPGISQLSPFIPDLSVILGKDLQDFSESELPRLKELLSGWIPTGGFFDGLAEALSTAQGSTLGARNFLQRGLDVTCERLNEVSTQCFLKELARRVGETWGTAEEDAQKVETVADNLDTFGLLPASAEIVCRHSAQILPMISFQQSIATEQDVKEVVNSSIDACK